MFAPPSLAAIIVDRSFRAENGELGILLSDSDAFIDACAVDGISELGWELWIVEHWPSPSSNALIAAPGLWSGLFPTKDDPRLGVMGGSGSLSEVREQISGLDELLAKISQEFFPFVRVNFTIL